MNRQILMQGKFLNQSTKIVQQYSKCYNNQLNVLKNDTGVITGVTNTGVPIWLYSNYISPNV